MKKEFLCGLALVCGLSMTACDDDDTDGNNDVSGTYNGYIVASSDFYSKTVTDEDITLTLGKDTMCMTSKKWGSFGIGDYETTTDGDTTFVTGDGQVSMANPITGSSNTYNFVVSGKIVKKTADIVITASIGSIETARIEFVTGELPAAYALEGDYAGSLGVSILMTTTDIADTVVLKASSDGTLDLIVGDVVYSESMTIPSFTISGLEYTSDANGNITLKEKTINSTTSSTTVTGTVNSGTITTAGKMTVDMEIQASGMPFSIKVLFSGDLEKE